MEHVALNDPQLSYLAYEDPVLKKYYVGTFPCDRLPKHSDKSRPRGYIVNTDPHDQPGQHWIALWTQNNVCEVMDSYALPLDYYSQAQPLRDWLTQWKYVVTNGTSLQGLHSQACGHYALMYLKTRANGFPLQDFVKNFSDYNRVQNVHHVGELLKQTIVNDQIWSCDGKKSCTARA